MISPDALYDVQIKRLHEYTTAPQFTAYPHPHRRLLNDPDYEMNPRVLSLVPRQHQATHSLKTLSAQNKVGEKVNSDPINGRLDRLPAELPYYDTRR